MSSTDLFSRPPLGGRVVGRGRHLHRAIRLSQVTIAWSLLTGLSAVAVGIVVGGLSLAGYGLNAIADGTASVILLHRFHSERQDPHRAESLERRASRLVAIALLVISFYLGVSAIRALATHHSPDATALGVAIAVAAMIVLPPLAIAKRRTSAQLGSRALRADAILTAVAALLAAGALLSLVLDPAFGWWWADAVIALALVGVLAREAWSVRRTAPPSGFLIPVLATLGVAGALAVGGSGSPPATLGQAPQARPNVLVIQTDDQTLESIRVMENVNSLIGGQGVTFRNSFVNYSFCCPSRATFLTGQYMHNHRVFSNRGPTGGADRFVELHVDNNLAVWLRNSGYYTAMIGKYLNGYSNQPRVPAGWSEWQATAPDDQRVYNYTLNNNGNLVKYGEKPADFKQDVLSARAVDFVGRMAP